MTIMPYVKKAVVLAVGALMLAFSGCARETENIIVCSESSPYSAAAEADTGLELRTAEAKGGLFGDAYRQTIHDFQGKHAVEVLDAQAHVFTKTDNGLKWYPRYAAAVVIAADRDKTDADISGWRSLANAGASVSMCAKMPAVGYNLCAVSYGLERSLSARPASLLFKKLSDAGLFELDNADADVFICFDFQAASLRTAGKNIEVIIPSEGTLLFEGGVLAPAEVNVADGDKDAVISSGLRTPKGECISGLYPPGKEYERAYPVNPDELNAHMQSAYAIFRRTVLDERRYSTADGREHMLAALAFMIIALLWASAMVRRTDGLNIKILIYAAAAILVLWVFVRMVKWQTPDNGAPTRYLWYSYYIFQLGLPKILLHFSLVAGRKYERVPLWWTLSAAFSALLLAVVFTNDLHMLVFKMDLSAPDWGSNYGYGPLYYAILADNVLALGAALTILMAKSAKSPKKYGFVFPLAFCIAMLAYGICYILRVKPVWKGDFVLSMGILTLLFLESSMRSGLIRVNTKYGMLFEHSPLNMRIVNAAGETVLSAKNAVFPEKADQWALSAEKSLRIRVGDAVVRSAPIAGGAVVWKEDISAIAALQRRLAGVVRELGKSNALLKNEYRVSSEVEAAKAKRRIQEDLDKIISKRLGKIKELLEGADAENEKKAIARAGLELYYLKRRTNLMFRQMQTGELPAAETEEYFEDLAGHADGAGITCALLRRMESSVPSDWAVRCYSLLFSAICYVADSSGESELICRLTSKDGGFKMSLLSGASLEGLETDEQLSGGSLAFNDSGFLFEASVTFKGGEQHD